MALGTPVTDLPRVLREHHLVAVDDLLSAFASGFQLLKGNLGLLRNHVLLPSRCKFLNGHKLVLDAVLVVQVPELAPGDHLVGELGRKEGSPLVKTSPNPALQSVVLDEVLDVLPLELLTGVSLLGRSKVTGEGEQADLSY